MGEQGGHAATLRGEAAQSTEFRPERIATAEGEARYVTVGTGPPVILLHGLDGSWRWWTPTLRRLTSHFRCFALDFSPFDRWRERSRVGLTRAAAFVAAWLDALGLDRVHLLAHSMGGYSACQFAITHPARLDRLVLVAPAVLETRTLVGPHAGHLRAHAWTVAPRFLPILIGDSFRTGPLGWFRSVAELRAATALPLDQITAPTLLLWGDRDPLVPASRGARVQRQIAGSRLLVLPGARHVPMYERPDACNGAIERFLNGEPVGRAMTNDE
jgi:pimeloyl-ACP methyl ester carboxylesterase